MTAFTAEELAATAYAAGTFSGYVNKNTEVIEVTLSDTVTGQISYSYAGVPSTHTANCIISGLDNSYRKTLYNIGNTTDNIIPDLIPGTYLMMTRALYAGVVRFVDVIAVRVKPGQMVVVSGVCGTVNVATTVNINNNSDSNQELKDGYVYKINTKNLNIERLSSAKHDERMQSPPAGASTTIDLNGNDVRVYNPVSGWAEGQSSTIIRVNDDSSLTLMNSGSAGAVWGEGKGLFVGHTSGQLYRVDATVAVNGGRFYAIGSNNDFGIPDAKNYNIYGPNIGNDARDGMLGTRRSQQGAINIENDGGYVLLDGGVSIKECHHGITSFTTDPTPQASLIDSSVDITINIKNGASVTVTGNNDKPSYGICLLRNSGNTIVDDIDIMVTNSTINCTDSNSNSAAIRLANIHGSAEHPVEIKLSGATLNHSGTSARAIVLENCSYISITYDSSTVIYGNNSFTGSSNITVNGVPQ